MNIIDEIKDAFKKYNPDLYVIAIFIAEKDLYFVVAKHTPDKTTVEEDPFYMYGNGKVTGVTITDSEERMNNAFEIMQAKNRIYEID